MSNASLTTLGTAAKAALTADVNKSEHCAYGWVSIPRERGQERLGRYAPNYMQCRMTKPGIKFLLGLMAKCTGEERLGPCNDYGVVVDMLHINIAANATEETELPEDTAMSLANDDLSNNGNLDISYLENGEGSIIMRPNAVLLVGNDFDGPAYFFVNKEELEHLAA